MISKIVTGKDKIRRLEYIYNLCLKDEISKLDIYLIDAYSDNKIRKTTTLGIEDVREARDKFFLKPLSSVHKAIIFHGENITLEAQNSLLKILEEPPANTVIYLSFPFASYLLSTILSRCKLTSLESNKEIDKDAYNLFLEVIKASASAKLKKAEDLGKEREVATDFLYYVILSLQKDLYEKFTSSQTLQIKSKDKVDMLKKANNAYFDLTTTTLAPRFILENLFLAF